MIAQQLLQVLSHCYLTHIYTVHRVQDSFSLQIIAYSTTILIINTATYHKWDTKWEAGAD